MRPNWVTEGDEWLSWEKMPALGRGAVVGAIGWELAQRGFSWYLTSGFASYRLVYGSLGAVIAFMIWLYVTALVVLYGAHLSAAVAFHRRYNGETADPQPEESAS